LAWGPVQEPVFAQRWELSGDLTAGAAFEAIARNCLVQVRANQAAFFSGCRDIEVMHQLRVGALHLLADGMAIQLREDLGWL